MKLKKVMFGLFAVGAFALLSRGDLQAQSEAPLILTNPQNQNVAEGAAVAFTVTASGTDPLSYQWFHNGSEIPDATNSSYTIALVTTEHAGEYVASVSNDADTVLSQPAILTVETAPTGPALLDFNNDGKPDLLWVHPDGRIVGWYMDGTNFLGAVVLPYRAPSGWKIAGQADFNQDGKMDFLWQHMNGNVIGWLMDGTNRVSSFSLPKRPTGGWRIVGLSDLNDDGSVDLVWQHGNGKMAASLMDTTNFVESVSINGNNRFKGGWKVAGMLDLDEDGDKDVLWQHGGGRLAVWYMDGLNVERSDYFQFSGKTTSSWHLAGASDLDGDGEEDLIWQHSEGYLTYWLMNGTMEPTVVKSKGKKAARGARLGSR